jgi:hypothetical protein
MTWNWEQPGWPVFTCDSSALASLEQHFLRGAGEFIGAFRHVGPDDRDALRIELISDEGAEDLGYRGRNP